MLGAGGWRSGGGEKIIRKKCFCLKKWRTEQNCISGNRIECVHFSIRCEIGGRGGKITGGMGEHEEGPR